MSRFFSLPSGVGAPGRGLGEPGTAPAGGKKDAKKLVTGPWRAYCSLVVPAIVISLRGLLPDSTFGCAAVPTREQ